MMSSFAELESYIQLAGSGQGTVFKLKSENKDGIILRGKSKEHILLTNFTCHGISSHDLSTGVKLDSCGICDIQNVYSRNFSGYGFWIKDCFATRLNNNFTSGNDIAGTYIDRTIVTRGGLFVPNKIVGCYSYGDNGHGFLFERAVCQDIVGCVAYQMKGHGYYMRNSTSNLISGCRAFMGYKNGIMIENTSEMNISSNIIGWVWGHNLEINGCTWAIVTANEFIDAGGKISDTRKNNK